MTKTILKYERIVLSVVQEYLNKNRFFTLEEIIPFINVRIKKYSINLNYAGIREILKILIKKKQILERSKLTREEILDNNNRREIFTFINENPGVYFNQIANELNLSNYVLAWHIKILLKFNYIRSRYLKNHEIFFNSKIRADPEKDKVLSLISRKKVKLIIQFLNNNQEGSSKTRMSRELGMHSTTVNKYVSNLEELGILLKKELSNKTLYFLNERYYYELLNT